MWQSWVDSISKLENLISKTKEMAQMAGPDPIWTTCPNCNTEILTTTQKSFSTFQCLFAGGLCLFSCFCIFWIPLFIDEWKDVLHTCPNCNYAIGKYKKLWWKHPKKPRMVWQYIIITGYLRWIKHKTLLQTQSTSLS